jgi:SAM-dependent methyltransferase
MTAAVLRDPTGAETLDIMSEAPRYNTWQYERIAPYLGRRVCELGAGIGNMSAHLRAGGPEHLLLTDTDSDYLARLRRVYAGDPVVRIDRLELPDASAGERFRDDRLDTIVALNVLEHIEDDENTLRSAREMLLPGGRLVLLVPALPLVYGRLDRELGHFRRYTRRSLAGVILRAGFRLDRLHYYNIVGSFGWFFVARVLRRRVIPVGQLRAFERLVPLLRHEDRVRLPFGQSLIAVATR